MTNSDTRSSGTGTIFQHSSKTRNFPWSQFSSSALYKEMILEKNNIILTIEAGNKSSWEKYTNKNGSCIGINSFGESAPYKEIYDHFNLTSEKIVAQVQKMLRN